MTFDKDDGVVLGPTTGQPPDDVTGVRDLVEEPQPGSGRLRQLWSLKSSNPALEEKIFPALFERKASGAPVRAWVPGCSTGEDAYSIAILLADYADRSRLGNDIEIFATDLDPSALQLARRGSYSVAALAEVSGHLVTRFFVREEQRYRVTRRIRDSVVFAAHDLFADPPLSNMDLVFCNAMSIGRTAELAELLFPALARALCQSGVLFVGSSEKISPPAHLFVPVPGARRVYRKRAVATGRVVPLRGERLEQVSSRSSLKNRRRVAPSAGARGEALLIQKYAPPTAIVDEAGEVLRFIGNTGAFLEPAPGPPTNNLMSLARMEIRDALKKAFHRAVARREPVVTVDTEFDAMRPGRRVRMAITPIVVADGSPSEFVIAFEERGKHGDTLAMMQAELKQAREDLIRSTEEFQFTNEELRSANEELLSTNEELRSANEDLDGLMEELRTAREDSADVVQELSLRIDQAEESLRRARIRFERLTIPALILDSDLNIEDFNLASGPFFRVLEADRGRPASDIKHGFRHDSLLSDAEAVLRDAEARKVVVQANVGTWHVLQIAPRIPPADGVEISVHEVDARLLSQLRAMGVSVPDWKDLREQPSSVPPPLSVGGNADNDAAPSSSLGNFAAEIAHEIKDPLNTISLSAEYALRAQDPAKVTRALGTIRDAAQRCGRIVKSVLDLVRHESSSKWPNDVHVVVRHAAALMQSYLSAGVMTVKWQLAGEEALCPCNPSELEQVFVNLFKNAVQATHPQNCTLVVSSELSDDGVVIVVSDDGPGMPDGVADKVFDRLYSTRRKAGGTGLGLPLAKDIVAAHGGKIRVRPSPAGTAIEVSLPRIKVS